MGDIPKRAPLGAVSAVVMGQSPDSTTVFEGEGGLPFLQGSAEFGTTHPATKLRCSPPLRTARSGSILISVRAPVGVTNIADQDYCIGRGLAAISAKSGIAHTNFIFYAIHENLEYLHRRSQGSTFLAIGSKDILSCPIIAYPLPIQERIVEVLATVDAAIKQMELEIAKLRKIKSGMMHDLFTRGVLPDGSLRPGLESAKELYAPSPLGWRPRAWTAYRLEELTPKESPICYGILQPGEHISDGIPVVAIYNLNSDFELTHRCLPSIERRYIRSRIQENDVLLSVKGSIGRVDMAPAGFRGNISRDVARIRTRTDINPRFLRYLLEYAGSQQLLSRIAVGTTRQELSIGRLKLLVLLIPGGEEQNIVADALLSFDNQILAVSARLRKIIMLKSGLMHDLLTGRVRVSQEVVA